MLTLLNQAFSYDRIRVFQKSINYQIVYTDFEFFFKSQNEIEDNKLDLLKLTFQSICLMINNLPTDKNGIMRHLKGTKNCRKRN